MFDLCASVACLSVCFLIQFLIFSFPAFAFLTVPFAPTFNRTPLPVSFCLFLYSSFGVYATFFRPLADYRARHAHLECVEICLQAHLTAATALKYLPVCNDL